nr:MAG TPA: hypothetical protein [Caudoviricetes sp.]
MQTQLFLRNFSYLNYLEFNFCRINLTSSNI